MPRPEPWPEDLRRVFYALATAMTGNRLDPRILGRLPTTQGSIVPNHAVGITHTPGTSRRQRGHYAITIIGPRTDGRWNFRPGRLEALCLSAPNPNDTAPA